MKAAASRRTPKGAHMTEKEKENPFHDDDLGGDYARDSHRGGLGDNYAREEPEHDEEEDEIGIGKASE
jgi:hypothetical protein